MIKLHISQIPWPLRPDTTHLEILTTTGKVRDAVRAGDFLEWYPDRVKQAFEFGRGTMTDLRRHIKLNRAHCRFVQLLQEDARS